MKQTKTWAFPLVVGGIYLLLIVWSFHTVDRSLDWVQTEEVTEIRKENAAQEICGLNSAYQWLDEKTLQCFTKHGRLSGKQHTDKRLDKSIQLP